MALRRGIVLLGVLGLALRLAIAGEPPAMGPSSPAENLWYEPVADESFYAGPPPAFGTMGPGPQSEPLGFSGAIMQPGAGAPPLEMGTFVPHCQDDFLAESPDPHAPAPAVSSGHWLRASCWYIEQSAVYMERAVNANNRTVLARDFTLNPAPGDILQIPLSLGWEPGLRSTLGRYLGRDAKNRDHSVEFTFLGLTHWGAGESLTAIDAGRLFSPLTGFLGDVPAFDRGDFQSFTLVSDFNSYELNYRIARRLPRDRMVYTRDSVWRRQATPAPLPAIFAGLRVLTINELLNWNAEASGPPAANGLYSVTTHNTLVGPQVGAECFFQHNNWRLGIRGSGAGVVNWASQASRVRIFDGNGDLLPGESRDEHAEDDILAFAGGLNFVGAYYIRPRFSIRASYDLLWVTNLALAQNQLTFFPSTPSEISIQHSLFFQGASLGLEFAY